MPTAVSRTEVKGFTFSVGDSVHNYPVQPGGVYIITASSQGIGIEKAEAETSVCLTEAVEGPRLQSTATQPTCITGLFSSCAYNKTAARLCFTQYRWCRALMALPTQCKSMSQVKCKHPPMRVTAAAEAIYWFAMAVLEGASSLPPNLQQKAVTKLVAYVRRQAAALERRDPLRFSNDEVEAILCAVDDEDWAAAEEERGRLASMLQKLVPTSEPNSREQASAAVAASLQVHPTSLSSNCSAGAIVSLPCCKLWQFAVTTVVCTCVAGTKPTTSYSHVIQWC